MAFPSFKQFAFRVSVNKILITHQPLSRSAQLFIRDAELGNL